MTFSLIICTYERPGPLSRLLDSVKEQMLYPDEILVVDGSPGNDTENKLKEKNHQNLQYCRVGEKDRGLTRQRNYGISRVSKKSDIICFLDDDTILTSSYFKRLIKTYLKFPDAVGVGGYIENEVTWKISERDSLSDEFQMDGYIRKLGSRNLLRKKLGLLSKRSPGVMPEFSNGLSISFLPPSNKVYPVEFFMGGVASYRRDLFYKITFSKYFQGYGLYEDMDFCIRASKVGQLYVNTAARLYHYHDEGGRPNYLKYGKMVMRNGWYVWRVKYPRPSFKARFKWHATAFLLTFVRLGNSLTTSQRKRAFMESLGRAIGWWSLMFNKPENES